jgi:hypothetical protein
MPSKKKRPTPKVDELQFLRGGKAPPKSVLQQCLEDMQQRGDAELGRAVAYERQMAKHFDQVQQQPRINTKDPAVSRSLDSLLALHKKFSKQKLPVPKVGPDVGGIFPGRISVNVAAPFDFDHTLFGSASDGVHVATRSASASKLNGQIDLSAVTVNTGMGGGSAFGVVGLYFHPVGSGTLTVRATPTFSFQRWTNSIRPTAIVKSTGTLNLTIFGVDAIADSVGETNTLVSSASTNIFKWDEEETNQVRFDFKSDLQIPASVSLEANHTLVYFLFVAAQVSVFGAGWPGSLAGSKMSITVPSIAYDYELHPVLQQ